MAATLPEPQTLRSLLRAASDACLAAKAPLSPPLPIDELTTG